MTAFIVLYRKPLYHENWPWQEMCQSEDEKDRFIAKLSPEYDIWVFVEEESR